ncbi:hypothetical protein EN947_29730 [Mesorhizobium sp. M7A.F.Ca.US.003.02.2.1]|nr:hypothetical protein EN947_29730 [Mesorhizobium sp. M7A.F.Ca.US.003.02.2.1]
MTARRATRPLRKRVPAMLLAALSVLAIAQPTVAQSQEQQPKKTQRTARPAEPKPANIDRNGVLILVRTSLLALDQANKTGNYTVLRDLGAPGFQANTAAKLGEIFAPQRQQALDLGGVAVLEPQLTLLPQIEPSGMLHMAGFFPSVPMQVNFELLFAPHERQWKLFGISVTLSNSAPEAPAAEPAPAPTAAEPPPEAPTPSVNPKKVSKGSGGPP